MIIQFFIIKCNFLKLFTFGERCGVGEEG